jgi:hypothetical protein
MESKIQNKKKTNSAALIFGFGLSKIVNENATYTGE